MMCVSMWIAGVANCINVQLSYAQKKKNGCFHSLVLSDQICVARHPQTICAGCCGNNVGVSN